MTIQQIVTLRSIKIVENYSAANTENVRFIDTVLNIFRISYSTIYQGT